jgi:hypothetical protein
MIRKWLIGLLAAIAIFCIAVPAVFAGPNVVGSWSFALTGACSTRAAGHAFSTGTGTVTITNQEGNSFAGSIAIDGEPGASACRVVGVVNDANRITLIACSLIIEGTVNGNSMDVLLKSIEMSDTDTQCVMQGTAVKQ